MSARLVQGVFESEAEILAATHAAREAAYGIVDVYAPYAMHGVDRAMGLRPSRLTWICFFGGVLGAGLALWFQFWTSAVDWPLNIGGKPFDSLPAFVPIAFEITVLFAGLGLVLAMFIRCGLVPGRKARMPDVPITDDRFVLLLRLEGAQHTLGDARDLLMGHGAETVSDYVEEQA